MDAACMWIKQPAVSVCECLLAAAVSLSALQVSGVSRFLASDLYPNLSLSRQGDLGQAA